MKRRAEISSPLIPIQTAIGTGVVTLAAAVLCPVLVPFALLSGIWIHRQGKEGLAMIADVTASKRADDIAHEWRETRRPGERGVDVSATLYSGGVFGDLPIKRTYRYELDEKD